MALTIKALNNDTSFLLTFAPTITPSNAKSPELFPGAFTILIDPWLDGPATIISQKFSIQEHTTPSAIKSLQDIPEPDMILISQDKPDHCHEETLCQLSPHVRSIILGPERVAKKIRSWQHFDFSCIQSLKKYNPRDPSTVYRLEIPAYSAGGTAGEITICFMEPRRDMSGLHTALGITYRPPASVLSLSLSSYVALPATPPSSRGESSSPSSAAAAQTRPQTSPSKRSRGLAASPDGAAAQRPYTPRIEHVGGRANTIVPAPGPASRQTERTVSLLYTPHGVEFRDVEPWAQNHLLERAALPLTMLVHGFNQVGGPWWAGGVMMSGTSFLSLALGVLPC